MDGFISNLTINFISEQIEYYTVIFNKLTNWLLISRDVSIVLRKNENINRKYEELFRIWNDIGVITIVIYLLLWLFNLCIYLLILV